MLTGSMTPLLGIVLSDRLLKSDTPKTSIDTLTAFSPESLEDRIRGPNRRKQVSCREEVAWWLQRLDPIKRKSLFNNPEDPLLITPFLHVVIATNSWFINEARFQFGHISVSKHDHAFPSSTNFYLNGVARRIRSGLYYHLKHLEKNANIVKAKRYQNNRHESDELLNDVNVLRDDMNALLRMVEYEIKYLGSKQAIEHPRTSFLEMEQINLLAKIGTVFVPLNIAAAVLAIPGPWYKLAIWAGLAGISVVLISFFALVPKGDRRNPEMSALVGFGNPRQRKETGVDRV
jgi:hypothetical protein